jgi:predicted O-linked N-acetylglucosamine transferase (SPINDLY family)
MSESDPSQELAAPHLDDLCGKAMQLQVAGRIDQAEPLYRQILEVQPRHAAANHCLGMLHVQLKRPSAAVPHLLAALEASPQVPDYWLGYLEALLLAGRTDEAAEALALGRQHGLIGAAVEDFAQRLRAAPTHPPAESRPDSTAAAPSNVPALDPRDPPATAPSKPSRADRRRESRSAAQQEGGLLNLLKQTRFAEALTAARTLTQRFPDRGLGWKVLGALLWEEGAREESLAALQTSVRLLPQDAEAHRNLGATLINMERFEDAERCLRRSLELDPDLAAPHESLGNAYQLQGRYAEAEASVRNAIALKSDDAVSGRSLVYSSLLFMLSHNPALGADALFAEHCRVGARIEAPRRALWPAHGNDRDPQRRLRVGLVSADLCNHAVASFIEPVLAHLSTYASLELHAYYNNTVNDAVNQRLRGYFKHWHPIVGLSDARLAQEILEDGIDILFDLSGHTTLNRLHAFARKPAPIQISWIGYPGTTGLRAMDYYLADRHFLPPGQFDRHFTEKLVYLPTGAPFQPYESAPPVGPLPALERGHVAFGTFNRIGKINPATIDLWSQLLAALPQTKLILGGLPPDSRHEALIERFTRAGVARERLTLHPRTGMAEYLALHHQVDICLDTLPYSGGTTTYHAFWMGVPTLTVAGTTPASRQGAAIVGQIGLDEFIATSPADFVAKGIQWSHDLAALAEVRASLRQKWQQSRTRDPSAVAAALERALRRMWSRWCAGLPPESFEIDAPHASNPTAACA